MSQAKKKLKKIKSLVDAEKNKHNSYEFTVFIRKLDYALSCQCREPLVKNNHCLKCTAHILKWN